MSVARLNRTWESAIILKQLLSVRLNFQEQTIPARNSRNIFIDKLISAIYRPQKSSNVNAPVPVMAYFPAQQHNAPTTYSELRRKGFQKQREEMQYDIIV